MNKAKKMIINKCERNIPKFKILVFLQKFLKNKKSNLSFGRRNVKEKYDHLNPNTLQKVIKTLNKHFFLNKFKKNNVRIK